MVDYDRLYYADIYNWTILPDGYGNEKCFTIYANKFSGWLTFSYYQKDKVMNLDGTMIYCDSFDKANKLVRDVLKVNKCDLHDRYLGRYFKLKKIMK